MFMRRWIAIAVISLGCRGSSTPPAPAPEAAKLPAACSTPQALQTSEDTVAFVEETAALAAASKGSCEVLLRGVQKIAAARGEAIASLRQRSNALDEAGCSGLIETLPALHQRLEAAIDRLQMVERCQRVPGFEDAFDRAMYGEPEP